MKAYYGTLIRWIRLLALIAVMNAARGQDPKEIKLPELDGNSAKGLQMRCDIAQNKFSVGKPVNIWCTVTNTTDIIKPIAWHPSTGSHFCLANGDVVKFEGILPLAVPQISEPIKIKSMTMRPGYILYLPAHRTLTIVLTYKPERAEKFKGRVVYDPLSPRNGWVVMKDKEEGPPWENDLIYSNLFEYEVGTVGK